MAEIQTNVAKMTESEDELSKTRAMLHKTQGYLRDEQVKHNQIVMKLKLELYQTQTNLKQQQAKSDKQLSEVIGHLLYLEGRLKKERTKVRNDILKKSKLIEEQKKYIEKLKVQNDQLLNAVKELYTCGGMNGIMRDWNSRSGKSPQNGRKNGKGHTPQSSHKSKLHSEKDEVWKRRGSLELSKYEVKRTLLENERLCSSQENLHTEVTSENVARGDNLDKTLNDKSDGRNGKPDSEKTEGNCPNGSESINGHDSDESHKVHNDTNGFVHDTSMNNSDSDLNTTHNTSEVSGATDVSLCDISINDSTHVYDLDDDDEHIFSFSSTHINSVIAEEDVNDPIMTHSGHMMSMGSMPMLTNIHDPGHMLYSAKNRPHSLSSVDLNSIQQQAQKLAKLQLQESLSESPTPPPSPLYKQLSHDSQGNPVNKNEKTAFQSFKNMFHRRGSKHKGAHKKRSVSLSQTTNKEYTEAMKKHFQKYDMS